MLGFQFRILALLSLGVLSTGNSGRIFDVKSVPIQVKYSQAGKNLTLPCPGLTENAFVLNLEWRCKGCYKDDSPIVSPNPVTLVNYQSDVTTTWMHEDRLVLLIPTYGLFYHPVTSADTGEYICLVNSRPQPEAIIRLFVQDVPDPPERPMILGFTSRAVNLSWAIGDNHNSPITHYIIYKRIGEDNPWDKEKPIQTETNATTCEVKGLLPFTVYSFRVVAVNGLGKSALSKESYFIITLREVPSGKPTITAAHNTSATSIRMDWRPPTKETLHGEFQGYRITYKARDKDDSTTKEIVLRDSKIQTFTVTGLETFTQYLVSLQVFNPEGPGPSTVVVVMTDEGVPGPPLNLSVTQVEDSKAYLQWNHPSQPNGIIQGYRLYFMHKNFTDVRTVRDPTDKMAYTLDLLRPYSRYKVWLKAFTWKNEGEPSTPLEITTDVSGPSAPIVTNLTCQSATTLFIEWRRPDVIHGGLDTYWVHFRSEEFWEFEEVEIQTNADRVDHRIFLPNLTTDNMYEVKIRGSVRSIYHEGKVYDGDFSESRKILLKLNCEIIPEVPSGLVAGIPELNAGIIAGVACASLALILAILAFILWRRCFSESYYYVEDEPKCSPLTVVSWDSDESVKSSIPAYLFPAHVIQLHADGDIGFSKEYESLQASVTQEELTADLSHHPENKPHNRYLNIVAYDHTRVKLKPNHGQKSGEYVNANYIDGFQRSRCYIATQGPLPSTFEPFWKMIWEQRVHVIVMITNLVERGRKKCDMYWPKEGQETYGVIQVKTVKETEMAAYTVRQFLIKHLKVKKASCSERKVYQYHYTNWPDHGTPEHPLPILSFIRRSSAANPEKAGPIVVHCSAGVGRTGAYIVIDTMLHQLTSQGKMNIYAFLRHIRTQRNFLVQTEEQYIFIHDALLEAILSGDTEVPSNLLAQFVRGLQNSDMTSVPNWQTLESQYKLIIDYPVRETDFESALKAYNIPKNRNMDFLPPESSRVYITPHPGVEGSDYINASWMRGYHKLQEFIISQHPLDTCINEFWQMILDHNSQTIVVLSEVDGQEFNMFWPTQYLDVETDTFKVVFCEENHSSLCVSRDFLIQSLQDDYEAKVRIIEKSGWPDLCAFPAQLFELITEVMNHTLQYQNGPLVIVDRYGGTEAATFSCLMTLSKQLQYENVADTYLYAKLHHIMRPGVWRQKDDYLFLYRAIEAHATACHKVNTLKNSNGNITCGSTYKKFNENGTVRIPPDGMETMLSCLETDT